MSNNYIELDKANNKEKCPMCGSDKVRQLQDHCSHGWNGYLCQDCGQEWGN